MQEKVNTVYNKSDVSFNTLTKQFNLNMKVLRRNFKKEEQAFPLPVRSDDTVGSGGSAVNYSAPTEELAPGFITIRQQLESAFLAKLRISAM